MKNRILIVTTVGTIVMSGCASKSIEEMHSNINKSAVKEGKASHWKSLNKSQKEDCIDCYVDIVEKPIAKPVSIVYNYVQTSVDAYAPDGVEIKEYKNPYLVDDLYSEYDNKSETLYDTIESKKNLAKNSIQVGAFRKYAGAKVYAKRYSLLTNKYNVDIKENVKNSKPIYRVQIEGFSNEREAKEFMRIYGLDGAFLVRK